MVLGAQLLLPLLPLLEVLEAGVGGGNARRRLAVLLQHRCNHGVGRGCDIGDGEEVGWIGANEARNIGGGGSQACHHHKQKCGLLSL